MAAVVGVETAVVWVVGGAGAVLVGRRVGETAVFWAVGVSVAGGGGTSVGASVAGGGGEVGETGSVAVGGGGVGVRVGMVWLPTLAGTLAATYRPEIKITPIKIKAANF